MISLSAMHELSDICEPLGAEFLRSQNTSCGYEIPSILCIAVTHRINFGYHSLGSPPHQNRSYLQGRCLEAGFYILYSIYIKIIYLNTIHIIETV